MAVLALIGVFTAMVSVRMDLIGSEETRELRRFQAFLRTQHTRTLYDGRLRTLVADESSNVIRVQSGGNRKEFQLEEWSLNGDRVREYRFTPWGVLGNQPLTLEHGDQAHTFRVNRLTGLVVEEDGTK